MANTRNTVKSEDHARPKKKASYGVISAGLGLLLLAAAGTQTLLETGRGAGASLFELLLIALGATVVVGSFVFLSWKRIYRYLASADAAVVVLVALMLMTVLGTVVLQEVGEAVIRERYGAAAPVLLALHLDDVFHSLPFAFILFLLALASGITVWRRRVSFKKWRHMGLLVSHISVLLILGGGLIGSLTGKRGMMHLVVGQSADSYMTNEKGDKPSELVQMDFRVRLDRFELDHYDPEYKFYTYEEVPNTDGWKVVIAQEPEVGATVGAARGKSSTSVTVTKLYKNLVRRNTAPDRHILTMPDGVDREVALGETVILPDGRKALIEDYFPDFVIDMESRRVYSRSDQPNNPAVAVVVTEPDGKESTAYLFGRKELRDVAHGNTAGLKYAMTPGPTELAEGDGEGLNPAAEVEVRWPSGKVDTALLVAANPKPIDLGGGRVLVYREKPEMIKNYRSTLTVVRNGTEVQTEEIRVNHPMYFEGYAFYQSNFDPKNPSYSGIEVVKDPGLAIVTFGLWALIAGVVHTIALRNWKPWWERSAVARAQVREVEVTA
ncbi:MAG: hypothetical protein AMXMBFR64_01200 [Myxococcales bacterium]